MSKASRDKENTEECNRRIQVDLSGQTAIVTGASRGIGSEVAKVLGAAGAKVACVARNEEKLKETADAIIAAGGTADVYSCDVTQTEAVQKVVDSVVEKWGKLDILVNKRWHHARYIATPDERRRLGRSNHNKFAVGVSV